MVYKAQIYLKKKEEGGRHVPIFTGYRPMLKVDGFKYACKVILPDEIEMLALGSNSKVEIEIKDQNLGKIKNFELLEGEYVTATGFILK